MKKVLIVITTAFVPWGGLTTVMMNYYRAMDKSRMQIDFAACNAAPASLTDELLQNGSRYMQLSSRKKHTVQYVRDLCRILKQERYDVVHIHGNSATMLIELLPAWFLGVKKRIAHVHTTKSDYRLANAVIKAPMNLLANVRLAVSKEAGHYLYGNRKFQVLRNAIDTSKYQFNKDSRLRCRKEWEISDSDYVVGTVGKMYEPKNQLFLVEAFSKVLDRLPDAKLMLVGDGVLRQKIEDKIKELGITDSCILTGMKENATDFLSAMDCFVFPSFYEGFGLALLEAQASGLYAICSENISEEVMATDLCVVKLLDNQDEWVEQICSFQEQISSSGRVERSEAAVRQIENKNLEIRKQADRLREIYIR
ncbi:MAG: glycosyltransferase [Bacteroidales bacterium]|nr:glycosyltransferase [Lachnoclostridium sp.]MCM1384117.1 glycosyltransferase [Lachnoclostridium sp.]MCM1465677.1 glycosyltransferase [Bacteroidales bacterium]